MKDLFQLIPFKRQEIHELVRAEIRQEQVEQDQSQENLAELNARIVHDPSWNRRFWSIQHVRDCADGKTFHWFWSPMNEVFALSQIMFMLVPVLFYFKSHGAVSIWQVIWWALTLKCLIVIAKNAIEWYHDWRFVHVWKRAKNKIRALS